MWKSEMLKLGRTGRRMSVKLITGLFNMSNKITKLILSPQIYHEDPHENGFINHE
jgi:hypothetical protein